MELYMFKTIVTLMRGAAAAAEEQVVDRSALLILDQQVRDAASAIERSKRALAIAIAQDEAGLRDNYPSLPNGQLQNPGWAISNFPAPEQVSKQTCSRAAPSASNQSVFLCIDNEAPGPLIEFHNHH